MPWIVPPKPGSAGPPGEAGLWGSMPAMRNQKPTPFDKCKDQDNCRYNAVCVDSVIALRHILRGAVAYHEHKNKQRMASAWNSVPSKVAGFYFLSNWHLLTPSTYTHCVPNGS